MKKILSIFMVLSMLLTMSISSVYAAETIDREALFGVSEEVLAQYDEEELREYESKYNMPEMAAVSSVSSGGGDEGTVSTLGQSGINTALDNSFKGAVWVTRDGDVLGIDHGHAAMVYTVADWDKSTLEHRGSRNPFNWDNVYSQIYNLEGDAYWAGVHSLKVYDVSDTDNGYTDYISMMVAADYCAANLMDLTYAPLAFKSSTQVNCASLIFKAYLAPGIELGDPLSAIVLPVDLVEDEKLLLKYNFQWPGAHTWDLP